MKPSNPKYGGELFQIAKGKVEYGETPIVAAKREAYEEIGLRLDNIDTEHHLGTFLGYTDIYYGRIKDKERFDMYGYETGETKWINVNDFPKIGRSIHIPIIRLVTKEIIKIEPSLQTHLS